MKGVFGVNMGKRKGSVAFAVILYPLSDPVKTMCFKFEEMEGYLLSRLKWKVTGMLRNELT